MNYKNFVEEIVKKIEEKVEKKMFVKLHKVVKNNGLNLDALVIMKENQNTAPNIYLNSYYEEYKKGKSLNAIIEEIMIRYHCVKSENNLKAEQFTQIEKMQFNIIYRLVHYKKNKALLEEIPHIRFVDFAITFHCLVKKEEKGIGSFRITNEIARKWKVTTKQLMKLAQKNTPRIFPVKLTTMEDLLTELFQQDMEKVIENYGDVLEMEPARQNTENMICHILKDMKERKKVEMFVLTNQIGINGASVILYPKVLQEFSELCGSDLYLLPSSVHEFIIVPQYEHIEKEELTKLVQEVNVTQVAADEVLSDHVYEYSKKEESITF